jgi:ABC-2 type transport system ATP-binding protein
MPVALSLQDVRVRYADALALDGVSLDVARGEIVGLVGPNGSGKSTTLAVAAGLLAPLTGGVAVEGVRRDADPEGFALRVGLVPQDCALYDELTAAENLAFFGRLYGLGGRELRRRAARALSRVRLTDRARHRVGTLSGGMKQRVNLAAALLHDPPVLLLDEPTAALDPAARDALFADLSRLREDGHAVLLSTHHLDEAELGCDRVAVLDRGRLVALGRPRDLFRRHGADRAVLYGQLRSALPKFLERSLRKRLGAAVEFDVTGRRLRLAAADSESLGRALALVLAEGVDVDTFRTPPGTLERVLHPRGPAVRSGACPT